MHKSLYTAVGLAAVLSGAGCSSLQTQGLQAASEASGADAIKAIEFSGTGRWYQFGQAPNPDLAWPQFDVKNFTADINYDTASARVGLLPCTVRAWSRWPICVPPLANL